MVQGTPEIIVLEEIFFLNISRKKYVPSPFHRFLLVSCGKTVGMYP